jgi:hypothetical protein
MLLENKESKVKIEIKTSVRGFKISRGQGPIDFAPIDIWRAMACKDFVNEYALNTDYTEFRKKIGANGYICYSRTKPKMGFSARDFIMNYLINLEADGTFILVTTSTNCNWKEPENKGLVRGELPISGYVMTPDKDDPNKSYVYVINEVDLKSSVPNFLLRQA